MFATRNAPSWRAPSTLRHLVVPAASALLLYAAATLGPTSPLGAGLLLVVALVAVLMLAQIAPLVLLWMVPASMCVFVYTPVLHYELLTFALLGIATIPRLAHARLKALRLDTVQWKWLLFVILTLPGWLAVTNAWRFFGALKLYLAGWAAFEVTRRMARRFGRESLLWGPATLCLIAPLQVLWHFARSGVPVFKLVAMRNSVTELGWAHANGVASVLLICAPGLVYLVQCTLATLARGIALASVVSVFVTSLLVAARGPFLLASGFLLITVVRVRRSVWAVAAAGCIIALALAITPVGQGLVARFSGPEALISSFFRLQAWHVAWDRGAGHLPWGIGAGQGLVQNDELMDTDPHNFLLSLFSEVGVPATLVWLWMFGTLWAIGLRLRREEANRRTGSALLGTLAVSIANALFDPTLTSNIMHLLFWWVVGTLEGGAAMPDSPSPIAPAPAPSGGASGLPHEFDLRGPRTS